MIERDRRSSLPAAFTGDARAPGVFALGVCLALGWCAVASAQSADPPLYDPTASLRLSYLHAYRSVALALHGLTAAFISLRLGWNWRQEDVPDAMVRALPPGLGYGAVAMGATLLIWRTLGPETPLARINLALMLSFLIGTALGSPLAWWLANRARANAPQPIDMDAEIQRRLALLRSQATRDAPQRAPHSEGAATGEEPADADSASSSTNAPQADPSTPEAPQR